MTVHTEILLIAIAVSIACAIPGVFLVLRRMSMMADAITHTVFLGIVLAFFVTEDLNSPLLLVGATVVGVGTVWLTEMVHNTGLVNEDASIGIIFPLLFSIAIILVSLYSGNAHLDVKTTRSAGFLSVTVRPVTSVISIGLLFAVSFFISPGPPHAAMSILTIRMNTVAI